MKARMLGIAVAALAGLNACSEGGTTDPPPTPTVSVTLGTTNGQITQGGTLAVPVTITRGGGFDGAVTLTVSGVAGVTANAATIAAGSTSTTLTLNATTAVVPGTANLTVTASGPNNTPTATATLALTVNVLGTYTLAANPTSVSIVQGATSNSTISVNRAGGFVGAVALSASAPAGITATLTPASLTGTTTATLAVTAAATQAAGTYPITITGTTPGLGNQTLTVNAVVTAAGSYTMAVAPATLPVQAGQSGTATVTLTRVNNFAGTVNLAATAPTGITVTANPAAVTGTTSTLTVAVASTVAAGNHTVTVTGTSTGLTNQTATFTVNVTAAPTGSFSLAIAPATVPIQAGQSGTATVTITRVAPFTGTVNLTATAPAGITVTANPAAATAGTATLTIAVAASVAAGNHTITLNGTGTGVANASATMTVNVTAAPAGGFTLALNPSSLAVQQGGSNTSTVTITRTGGFTGDVALTATVPANVTVSFSPPTLSGATTMSTMTINAAAGAATGASQITVRGNATGQSEQTAALSLTVNPTQGGSGNVTFTFCGDSGIPVWVAVQDGDGPWTRVTGNASNQFAFQISSGRGGVMYVTPAQGGGFDTQIYYMTTAELQGQGSGLCFGTTGTGKTVTAAVSGLTPPLEFGFLTLGQSAATLNSSLTSATFNNVLDGPVDLVGARASINIATFAITPNALVIQRNLNPANNTSVGPVNFAAGIAPAMATLTFANAGTDWTGSVGLYYTPRNTIAALYTDAGTTTSATRPWYGFPQASMQAGELHVVSAVATVPTQTGLTQTRQLMFVTANVANRTVTFGAALNAPTVTVAATAPHVRLRLDHTPQPDYDDFFVANFQQGTGATYRSVTIQKTAAYVAAGGQNRMEIPDATAAAGWSNTWALAAGAVTTWTFTASAWSGGNGLTAPFFVEGSQLLSATRMGQITP